MTESSVSVVNGLLLALIILVVMLLIFIPQVEDTIDKESEITGVEKIDVIISEPKFENQRNNYKIGINAEGTYGGNFLVPVVVFKNEGAVGDRIRASGIFNTEIEFLVSKKEPLIKKVRNNFEGTIEPGETFFIETENEKGYILRLDSIRDNLLGQCDANFILSCGEKKNSIKLDNCSEKECLFSKKICDGSFRIHADDLSCIKNSALTKDVSIYVEIETSGGQTSDYRETAEIYFLRQTTCVESNIISYKNIILSCNEDILVKKNVKINTVDVNE